MVILVKLDCLKLIGLDILNVLMVCVSLPLIAADAPNRPMPYLICIKVTENYSNVSNFNC